MQFNKVYSTLFHYVIGKEIGHWTRRGGIYTLVSSIFYIVVQIYMYFVHV